jgi:hypothetical protein
MWGNDESDGKNAYDVLTSSIQNFKRVNSEISKLDKACNHCTHIHTYIYIKDTNLVTVVQGCQMVCFQTKSIQIWVNLEGLRIKNVETFYGRLHYFTAIRNILCCGIWYTHLYPFWYIVSRKIWQPWNTIPPKLRNAKIRLKLDRSQPKVSNTKRHLLD